MGSRSFQDLIVWQKAHELVLYVYRVTQRFPKEEMYCLTSQLRRAAVSVPANIAEGFVKQSDADKLRFFNISQGSLEECRYYFLLVSDLGYLSDDLKEIQNLATEVSRLLHAYMREIRKST
ncbi:four helix bundle protein [Prosthecochloris sp. SCSIO W1103]|uniref:four helix bundle protein n=1 Tax=Prosthecochloris sp. SCSIO W1103 TaxID=2992244 RepID=UPI00223CCB32|nr:four helix bundle protein [Prosthecochloris sp. SCSIO W1103]UZJ38156.1 four helix bundle protein [Prosthecochloris sp. SCSIO W1103]